MRSEGRTRRPEPLNILGSGLAACALEVVSGLPVQPELRAVAEIEAKAQRRIDGVPPPGVGDFGNAVGRSADRVLSRYCGDPVLLARVPRSRRIRLATAETAPEAKELAALARGQVISYMMSCGPCWTPMSSLQECSVRAEPVVNS
jgi:hypothetical protein